jgi:single-strand DNA-binding protein
MLNKVMIIGNLGADPELRTTTSGTAVCELRMATNESWFDKASNERKERVEWHRVIVWGKSGENCAKYLSKGSKAFVEGRIQTREWNDKDGNKRHTTEIIANSVQFLDSRGSGGGTSPQNGGKAAGEQKGGGGGGQFDDDSIPF